MVFDFDKMSLQQKDDQGKNVVGKNNWIVKVEEVGDFNENASVGLVKGGSIAERRAAKCGFDASRINVGRFRSITSPLSSPAVPSPYLTIPAGISPTALFDFPVMLPDSQAHPSPTTGTYPSSPCNHESLMPNSVTAAADRGRNSDVGSSFSYKIDGCPLAMPCISALAYKPSTVFEFAEDCQRQTVPNSCANDSFADEVKLSDDMISNANYTSFKWSQHANTERAKMSQFREPANRSHLEEVLVDANGPANMLRTSEDGYNWRKYGQKQVKGSEYPRSYYKCTHSNCLVKKKVERSLDGQITEIIYKGAHNHPKPQPSCRAILGAQFSCNEILGIEGNVSDIKLEEGLVCRNTRPGFRDMKVESDSRADGLEGTSSTSALTEISDLLPNTQGKILAAFQSDRTPELSSTFASHDGDDEDGVNRWSISPGEDAAADESESKRRRKDSSVIETNLARATREPRIVVQIESEVDVLDDGYRWRKYGQKVVKGNPNPRSYYKCTSVGCPVRKHVERASHNLKSVITAYEGKHNHEVPVAKNSTQVNSLPGNLPQPASRNQPMLALARSANASNPEAQVHDLTCYEKNSAPNDEFIKPYTVGNLGEEMKYGASSVYQMKLPSLSNSISFGSFLLFPNHNDPQTACSVPPVLPDFPFSLPASMPGSAHMDLSAIGLSIDGKPVTAVQSFLDGQQLSESDVKFIKPKEEHDDNLYRTGLSDADHGSTTSPSVLCQIIGNYVS